MKAVIVECSSGAAVALCGDGSFRKLKGRNYSVGQELVLKEKASHTHLTKTLAICASFALVLLSFGGIGTYSYISPYSYVSLDINPSIEYALNRYDKVIHVSGMNDDGQQVVSSIESDITNQNITTALGVTIQQLEKEHYISEEEDNHVLISVCSSNDSKAQAIASRVDTFSEEETLCSIETVTVSTELKSDADSLGITPGKMALINAVAETTSDADFDASDWTDKTVNELETTLQQASAKSEETDSTIMETVADDADNTNRDNDDVSDDSSVDDTSIDSADNTVTDSALDTATDASSTSADKPNNSDTDNTSSPAKSDTTQAADITTPAATINGAGSSEDSGTSAEKPSSINNVENTTADDSDSQSDSSEELPSAKINSGKKRTGHEDPVSTDSEATEGSESGSPVKDESESPEKGSTSDSTSAQKPDTSSAPKESEELSLTEETSQKHSSAPECETELEESVETLSDQEDEM